MTDKIKTRGPTDEYRGGWERIWGADRRKADCDSLPPFGADAADVECPLPVRRGRPVEITDEIIETLKSLPQPPDGDDYFEEKYK